jgi:hypothetical protein
MVAQMLGWITIARADQSGGAAPPPTTAAPANALPTVRRALREFDRFLDHHPLLEDQLRLDSKLTVNKIFLEKNPELSEFLRGNPSVAEGLKIYPRYYLYRALLRQADAPVPFRELAPLKELFQQEPKLEQELIQTPESIRDPVFLKTHPTLRDCLVQHPALAQVFIPLSVPQESK